MRAKTIKVELNENFNFDNISKEAIKLIRTNQSKSETRDTIEVITMNWNEDKDGDLINHIIETNAFYPLEEFDEFTKFNNDTKKYERKPKIRWYQESLIDSDGNYIKDERGWYKMVRTGKVDITMKSQNTRLQYATMLPCTADWCSTCDGSGGRSKYDIEGYDIDAMLYEDGVIDERFAEDYFGGRTDVKCNVCNGLKIQNVVDYDSCNELQKEIVNENNRVIQEQYEDMINAEKVRRAENGWAY
jgi:hypothetical protein